MIGHVECRCDQTRGGRNYGGRESAIATPEAFGWALRNNNRAECRRLRLSSEVVEVGALGVFRPLRGLEGVSRNSGQGWGGEFREGDIVTICPPKSLVCVHWGGEESNRDGTQKDPLDPRTTAQRARGGGGLV